MGPYKGKMKPDTILGGEKMMSEIMRLFYEAPLWMQILISGIIFIFFAMSIILVFYHEKFDIVKFWLIEFLPKKEEGLKKLKEERYDLNQENEKAKKINNLKHENEQLKKKLSEPVLPGRYFIGIDVGRRKIDYCLLDYKNQNSSSVKIIEDNREDTPPQFEDIYEVLGNIIVELSNKAKNKNIHQIDGIGLGLPGQVNPREKGILVSSPGFSNVIAETFIENLRCHIKDYLQNSLQHPEISRGDVRIEIDNDVRCATRYLWKTMNFDDVICIFVGNGLGSGIVLGGKMLYGHNFIAGEIGHTTISAESSELLRGQRCKCGQDGYHWEMYTSSYGLINIAKKLDPKEYERLKRDHNAIIQQQKYKDLLEDEKFREHKKKHFDRDRDELTSYFFSLAFHAGGKYACEVVNTFIKYLAVGIANYINVINPQIVYLGGGIIEGFCTDRDKITDLHKEVDKYILPSARGVTIKGLKFKEKQIASIGAALIFKDQSYFEWFQKNADSDTKL